MNVRVEQAFFAGVLNVWLYEPTLIEGGEARWRRVARQNPEGPYGLEFVEVDIFNDPIPAATFVFPVEAAEGLVEGISKALAWSRKDTEPAITPAHLEAADTKGRLEETRSALDLVRDHLNDMRRLALAGTPPLLDGSVYATGTVNVGDGA